MHPGGAMHENQGQRTGCDAPAVGALLLALILGHSALPEKATR